HSHCSISSPTLLPTRVIDVGDRNNPPFLFEPGELVAPYIALSHCWGKNPIVRTTTGTLAQRKQGIEMSLLPSDFRDAIVIARRLDVRYLWIDSLCIIQDDQLDWQTESAKMCTIYQDALLTISAGLSGHGGGSFFSIPHTTSGIFVRERRALQHYQFSSDFLIPLPSNHIARRAWVFQERLLSTRVLNFTRSEIVWECKTEDVADDPENESDVPLQLAELSTQTLKLFFEDQISVEDLSSKGLVLLWVNIIIHYSALQLSHPKDRLPALSGLAKRFQ
ncbi:hypothetical protein OIDMADRAFT_72987, partial [Oidiodendron maius Zn]